MEYDFNYLWECVVLFSENDNEYVSGPGIEQLVSIGFDMYHRGAPTEFDNQGFNKGDFTSFISMMGQLERDSIPASLAIRLLNMLAKYKNTQVQNYDSIYKLVQQDFAKLKSHVDHAGQTSSANKVIVYPQKEYNKNKVYIPIALDRSSVIKINVEIDGYFSSINQQKEVDSFGKFGYPRWKVFSKDKNQINIYWINPSVLKRLEGFFKSKGLEIEYQDGIAPADQPTTQTANSPQNNKNEDIHVIGLENHPDYGRKIAITFNIPFDRSKAVFDDLKNKGLSPSGIAYQKNPSRFLVAFNNEKFTKIIEVFKSFKLNTENLEKFHSENKGPAPESATGNTTNTIVFIDDSEDKLRIKPSYVTLSTEQKQFIKQLIQYTFPGYIWDGKNFAYSVKGTYKQYVLLGKLLKKFNYNVDDLRKIIASKIQKGFLQQTSWEGQYDDDEKFYNEIESKTPNSNFELYDLQKKDIAFLYGRDSAILGSETGFGKTVIAVTAAALRMQEKNKGKSTLIVTLKATQKQWVKEIISVMGQDEMDDISTDGKNPKKWTVLYYENFSAGNDVKDVLEVLKNHGFAIAIFDELHKLKHKNSLRSENILYVTKDVPTKWGASATVSSNKPMDVLNQLTMVGHHLGNIDKKKFKRDFSPDDKNNADASIIAAENLNRWLNLSGVYVRRSKSDVKDMPNLDVSKKLTGFDQSKFNHYFNFKLSDYKNPDLPISRLIAARESIAHLKTNETVDKAINIVSSNMNGKPAASKVVIFTNFTEAAEQLVNKASVKLKQLDPNFRVLTYLSNTKKKERDQVKELFTNNDNAKILVMSMKMGGTGIDFPNAAQNMLINDFDWTPESAEQSEGRIYRVNTNHDVNIQYVVSDGLDSELYEKVQKKRRLASIIQKYRKEYQEKE
jgi:superfamily II DNA or RNA helicase